MSTPNDTTIKDRISDLEEFLGSFDVDEVSYPSPPLLKRQNGVYREVSSTHSTNDAMIRLCMFTNKEIKYMIKNQGSLLTLNNEDPTIRNLPLLCDIKNTTHILKCNGDLSDNEGFFFTRFIMEDNIIPVFDKLKSPVSFHSVYLKVGTGRDKSLPEILKVPEIMKPVSDRKPLLTTHLTEEAFCAHP